MVWVQKGSKESPADLWGLSAIIRCMAAVTPKGSSQMPAAGVVMVAWRFQRTGLLTNMLVSNAFGTSAGVDAFYAANRVTEIMLT